MENWMANLGGELQGNCWCLLERQLHFRDVKVIFLALVTWMGGDWEGEGEGDGEDTRCTSMLSTYVDEDCVVTPTAALMGAGLSSKRLSTRPLGPEPNPHRMP